MAVGMLVQWPFRRHVRSEEHSPRERSKRSGYKRMGIARAAVRLPPTAASFWRETHASVRARFRLLHVRGGVPGSASKRHSPGCAMPIGNQGSARHKPTASSETPAGPRVVFKFGVADPKRMLRTAAQSRTSPNQLLGKRRVGVLSACVAPGDGASSDTASDWHRLGTRTGDRFMKYL